MTTPKIEALKRAVEQARCYVERDEQKLKDAIYWLENARAILTARERELIAALREHEPEPPDD